MPQKKSPYVIKFQIKEGVDESICRSIKFARKKMEQLGNTYPNKEIYVVISGTHSDIPKKFSYLGAKWQETIERLPSDN